MSVPIHFENRRGDRLAGELHGDPTHVAVICCHGMLSTKDGPKHVLLARELERAGLPCLRFDFAGRGASEGRLEDLCFSAQVDDLEAAIDLLAARGVERLGLFGSSMGGAVALLAAARDERVVAIATLAAIGHAAAAIERNPTAVAAFESQGYVDTPAGRLGRKLWDDAREHDILSAVRVLHAPLLVIHGENDDVVPVSDAHDIAATARNASLEIVSGAGHRFDEPGQFRPVVRDVTRFFVDKLVR